MKGEKRREEREKEMINVAQVNILDKSIIFLINVLFFFYCTRG